MQKPIIILTEADEVEGVVTEDSSFFDIQGNCYAGILYDSEDGFGSQFAKRFGTEIARDVLVVFQSHKSGRLMGWFDHATVHRKSLFLYEGDFLYNVWCRTCDAFFLPLDARVDFPFALDSSSYFHFPSDDQSETILSLVNKMRVSHKSVPLVLDEALADDSLDMDSVLEKFWATFEANLLPHALAAAKRKLRSNPKDIDLLMTTGRILITLARPQEAVAYFDSALALNPSNEDAVISKGCSLLSSGKIAECIAWLNKALIRFDNDEIRYHLARAYYKDGHTLTAYKLLKKITSADFIEWAEQEISLIEESMSFVRPSQQVDQTSVPYPLYIPEISEFKIPTQLSKDNMVTYFDPIRRKLVAATPEEKVRQQIIRHLVENMKTPEKLISVEVSLAGWDRSLSERVDILVFCKDRDYTKSLLLIECKMPHCPLEGDATRQAMNYNRYIRAPYVMITNGLEAHLFFFDEKQSLYTAMRHIPDYKELCRGVGAEASSLPPVKWKRPPFEVLHSPLTREQFIYEGLLGSRTPESICAQILNLAFCLLDTDHQMSCPIQVEASTIVADNGVVYISTGNPSGGVFSGSFRWFTAQDRHGITQQVFLAVLGTLAFENDPQHGGRGGYTSLVCAVQERGVAVSRLEIRLDTCLVPAKNKYRLTHSGVRSRKKAQPLIDFVAQHAPSLIGPNGKILLGELHQSENLYLSDFNTATTVANLVSYLLLRSELRALEDAQPY